MWLKGRIIKGETLFNQKAKLSTSPSSQAWWMELQKKRRGWNIFAKRTCFHPSLHRIFIPIENPIEVQTCSEEHFMWIHLLVNPPQTIFVSYFPFPAQTSCGMNGGGGSAINGGSTITNGTNSAPNTLNRYFSKKIPAYFVLGEFRICELSNRWRQLTLVLTLKEISFQLLRLFTKSNFNFTFCLWSELRCFASKERLS